MKDVMKILTKPAILASISYLILAFMILLPLGVVSNEELGEKRYNFSHRLLIVIIMLIPIGLSIYSINCMVVGGCSIWAWIQGIALAFWVLLFILVSLMSRDQQKTIAQTNDPVKNAMMFL